MTSQPSGFAAGFQVSLEISKFLPVAKVGDLAFQKLLDTVRRWRNSGSDVVVEEDLASIFGKVWLSESLEANFKRVLQRKLPNPSNPDDTITIPSIYKGSVLGLDKGCAETVIRALPSGGGMYLSSVVQLSLLGWMHERNYLATAIEEALEKRIANERDDAINPGFDGISKVLAACSTQTASFPWHEYIRLVEDKMRERVPSFQYKREFTTVTPNMLFAAIDGFRLMQRLPDDYTMEITGLRGCITVVIWAYYTLDLAVEIVGSPGGNIRFGHQDKTHVFICWDDKLSTPEIQLLDKDNKPVFQASPHDDATEHDLLSAPGERIALKEYCLTRIRRELNSASRVPDGDQVELDIIDIVQAITLVVSKKIYRVPLRAHSDSDARRENEWPVALEEARVFNSATTLFGRAVDEPKITQLAKRISGKTFNLDILPGNLQEHMKKTRSEDRDIRELERLLQSLVSFLLLFAFVDSVETCANAPLILMDSRGFVKLTVTEMLAENGKVEIEECTLFHDLCHLLVGGRFGREDRDSGGRFFAVSDFGWSIHLDTLGDRDPEAIRPEILHLKEGVWLVKKSWRRKLRIRDANHSWHWDPSDVSQRVAIDRGDTYEPRCVTNVLERKEYGVDRDKEVLVDVKFEVDESNTGLRADGAGRFEVHSSFRFMHVALWTGVKLTQACAHNEEEAGEKKLHVDAVTVGGLGEGLSFDLEVPERICIALVHGDSRARWLSVLPGGSRQVMLRRQHHTCVDCAVREVALLKGKWLVVL